MTTPDSPPETSPIARPVHWLVRAFSKAPEPQAKGEDLPVTETLALLVPGRRQAILEELAAPGGAPVVASVLAEQVACAEYECTLESLDSDQRKRVYIALLQSHLPKLDDGDVITYDVETRCVDRGPAFEHVWRTYLAVRESLATSSKER